jgi:hypothetical protein
MGATTVTELGLVNGDVLRCSWASTEPRDFPVLHTSARGLLPSRGRAPDCACRRCAPCSEACRKAWTFEPELGVSASTPPASPPASPPAPPPASPPAPPPASPPASPAALQPSGAPPRPPAAPAETHISVSQVSLLSAEPAPSSLSFPFPFRFLSPSPSPPRPAVGVQTRSVTARLRRARRA